MTQTPITPPFERFSRLIESTGLNAEASEIHGVMCGVLCAGHADAHAVWFQQLLENRAADDLLVRELRQMLGQLYQLAIQQMNGDELSFTPYLPDEKSPLMARARCLSEWCEGFLYGLGLAGITEAQLAGDSKEAIRDIAEITRLDYETVEVEEESEAALMELEEFIKVAVLLIWEELAAYRRKTDATE